MGNGCQNHKFGSPKIEAVAVLLYFASADEIHAGKDEKQLIDLEYSGLNSINILIHLWLLNCQIKSHYFAIAVWHQIKFLPAVYSGV